MFGTLTRAGASLANGLLDRVGAICAGANQVDALGDAAAGADAVFTAARAALGAAIRALGPESVLFVLPLDVEQVCSRSTSQMHRVCAHRRAMTFVGAAQILQELSGTGNGRAWLLPLLREHVLSARLLFWKTHLAPLARTLAEQRKDKQGAQSWVLASQVWCTLPSFCSWAEDTPEALRYVVALHVVHLLNSLHTRA